MCESGHYFLIAHSPYAVAKRWTPTLAQTDVAGTPGVERGSVRAPGRQPRT
jgi:hypothetical protein